MLRIRIHMFLGLLDPDPLVRDMDPDPSIITQKKEEKPWFLQFYDSSWLFIFKNDVHVPSKSNKQKQKLGVLNRTVVAKL